MPKIHWKYSLPIVVVLLIVGTGIWFLPVYGYYFEQRLVKYLLNGLIGFSSVALVVILVTGGGE